MDLKFQTSFIPKQPVTMQSAGPGHISVIYLVSIIIFIVTLGLGAAAFISQRVIKKNIENLSSEIKVAKDSFELSTIGELQRINSRIEAVRKILDNHVAVSKFLDVLGKSTYVNVSFSDFSFGDDKEGPLKFTASGQATSFNTLILQKGYLAESKEIENGTISDFNVDENGRVTFKLNASIKPEIISYKKYLPEK